VIEGFYGPPYRHAERLQILAFVAEHGLDTYLYAPKQDPYHRDEWRTPYPASEAADLAALITRGSELGVRVVLAIAPGGDYDGSSADEQALRAKLDQLLDLGARDVCVLFDDVASSSPVAEPVAQVAVLRLAYDHVRARTPDATLCFIGPYYFGTAEQLASGDTPPFPFEYEHPSHAYYAAYRALPRDMPILWTRAARGPLGADRRRGARHAGLRGPAATALGQPARQRRGAGRRRVPGALAAARGRPRAGVRWRAAEPDDVAARELGDGGCGGTHAAGRHGHRRSLGAGRGGRRRVPGQR
jgi:hypothetical protein